MSDLGLTKAEGVGQRGCVGMWAQCGRSLGFQEKICILIRWHLIQIKQPLETLLGTKDSAVPREQILSVGHPLVTPCLEEPGN